MATIFSLLRDYAWLFVGCGVLGALLSFLRESQRLRAPAWRLLEWLLVPLGYAAVFVLVQEKSVRAFAFQPAMALGLCASIVVACSWLLVRRRRRPGTALAWAGGFFGVPGIVVAGLLAGTYLQSPGRFEQIRATIERLEQKTGQTAPDFTFTRVENRETQNLAALRGKLVLLNVWATWCAPCLREMPDLDRLQTAFGFDRLVVLHLSDEPLETIGRYLARHRMTTIHGRVEIAAVPAFYEFGATRPTSFLLGPDGKVLATVSEAKDFAFFEALVRSHLQ